MRRSSINNLVKIITAKNYYQNQLPYHSLNTLSAKRQYFNQPLLFSTIYKNKLFFQFSTSNNKPPIKGQNQGQNQGQSQGQNPPQKQSEQGYSAKHKQKIQQDDYVENAQMTPDGQTNQKNQSGFVPTAFGNYFIGISCICLLLAYAVMEVQFMRAANAKKSPAEGAKKVVAKGKAHIGGDWQLLGTDGKPISSKDFAGKYYLIYFGFCNCPDICPNSLMKLAKALQKVHKTSDSKFFNLESVFVSVDPDRDTPQKIQKFAKYFDKSMIGVTGKSNDDPALKQMMRKFKIYSSKIQFEDQESVIKGRKSYTIDHTILTYLMNPKNQYVAHIGANLGQHDMANLILQKIKEDQRSIMQKLKV